MRSACRDSLLLGLDRLFLRHLGGTVDADGLGLCLSRLALSA